METAELEVWFSTTWDSTIQRLRASLDPDDRETIQSFKSWPDIQDAVSGLPPSIALIKPALRHLNDFVIFFESGLGPKLDASFVWGSLTCLLQLSVENSTWVEKIPRMVKSLAHRAEAFNGYCNKTTGTSNSLKEACFDMQVHLAEFFTSCIKDIHDADDSDRMGTPMHHMEHSFARKSQELGEVVARIERLEVHHVSTQPRGQQGSQPVRCLMLPDIRTTRLYDRVDVFEDLDRILGSPVADRSFRSVALYGLSGVGKSSIASSYMEARYKGNVYDICLWVRGENRESLRQSFTEIALRLKLPGAQEHGHDDNLYLVQDWFQANDCRWLVVYDNVVSADILMPYWPTSSWGKAIITCRDYALAFEPASAGLEIQSWDDKQGSQFLLWLLKKNIGRDLESESDSALTLSQRLSGHALAISQTAGLIQKFQFSIRDFMVMYLKNPRNTHDRGPLKAVWEISFKSLSEKALSILGVIAYLMPDSVPQELFVNDVERELPNDLAFCVDEFEFHEELGSLASLSLIKRDVDTRILSTHRMVQTQFKYFLTPEQRQNSFNNAVSLAWDIYPSEQNELAQMFGVWEACNRYTQQVLALRDFYVEERKVSKNFQPSWKFCDLLARCQRYLFETDALADLEKTCDVNMDAAEQLEDVLVKEDLKATTLSHQIQMAELLGDAERGIRLSHEGYAIRLAEKPQKRNMLCYTAANLGSCYNTANQHEKALEWLDKAREWWGDLPNLPLNIITNKARSLLFLGDIAAAKELHETVIDMVKGSTDFNWAFMASEVYYLAGDIFSAQRAFDKAEKKFIEAQNAWLKGDQTRLDPFNGGCLYRIGISCLFQGKIEAAIKHIRDSMEVTHFHRERRPVEHARNLLALSKALERDHHEGRSAEAEVKRQEAEVYLRKRDPNLEDCSTLEAYDRLVPIAWR